MYSSTKTPLFGNFCALLQSISDQRGTQEKKKRLAKYIYDWRFNYGDDFYEAMRLLLPHLDRSRYGIKETMLAKAYTDALRLGKTSTDAYNLLKWKLPSTSKYTKSSGDFAAVAFEAISSRSTITTSTQSIHDVNVLLDDMSRSKSEEKRKHDLFKHIVEQYTPFEQKWMIRIILKDLKIGMSENSVFDVYHPQARELFSVCSNLEKVCKDLRDPHTSIAKSTIQLFEPFKPQLGHKEVPKDVRKVLFDGHFYIEDKIDGERIQMHFEKSTGKFRWFSRKSTDYTHLYGDSPQSSKLTGIIADCFEAESLILDGEMIGYDPKLDVFLPFGSLKTTAKDETLDPHKSRPCFIVFDMVYCNGFQMSKYTLADRLKVLNSVVKEKRGYLNLLPREEKSTFQDIVHALDRAISLRKEGLVIKNPGSTYEPGARNPTWIKLKPEYIDSLHDNCDLIVIGAKYGTGRRGNRLAQFLCALRDDRIPDNENPKFLTFTMLGTGYTVDELDEFGKILENLQPYNAKNQPSWLVHPEKSDEVPDVIVHYAKSVVVEVKATEIVWGNMFGSGSTLRFPRFMRFRKDKSWSDIMTYSEMVAAKRSGTIGGQVRASASQHDFLDHKHKRAKTAGVRSKKSYSLLASQRGIDTKDIERRSKLFEDMTFYVVTGGNGHTKNGLEEKIQENGGTFVQTEITAQYVIAGNKSITVNSIIYHKNRDIILPQWIIDCDEKQDMVPLAPKYMLFATNKSEQLFRVKMDQWGDMYTQDTTEQTLGEVLSQIKVDISDVQKMRDLCEEIQERYFKEPLPGMIFQRVNAYLDLPTSDDDMNQLCYLKLRDKLWLVSMQIQFYGGTVVDDIKPGITHVVMDKERLEKLLPLTRSFLG
ncbi:DNA ligase (ATP) [Apophysomyces sp. BC1034]|nr:DNA ligase (ATP) [Apophysomyces sp. BC1021]KAG0190580.1 DNA ligase (ATP) [Apophysomyces sp. BC1034]